MTDAALARLIERWDDQQGAYITHREQRFAIVLDALAHLFDSSADLGADGAGATVVDLACGPGSLSQRLLDRFPAARVIGIDYDPVLLSLARAWLGAQHPGRFTALDADLAGEWRAKLGGAPVHAAVSSTALHWLEPQQLVRLYAELGALLPEGGLFLNADHLRYDSATQPFLTAAAGADDARTQREAHARGIPTWNEWWNEAVDIPALGALQAERERRFADRPPTPHAPLELHLSALRTAGFREAGTIWRFWDDVVVCARR
jgi:trans-aconitate methyltransferase